MQDDTKYTLDQIELNIGKPKNIEELEILVREDGTFCDNL